MNDDETHDATQDEISAIMRAQAAAVTVLNLALRGEDLGNLLEAVRMGRARLFVEFEPACGSVVVSAEWPAMQPGRMELKAVVPRMPPANG